MTVSKTKRHIAIHDHAAALNIPGGDLQSGRSQEDRAGLFFYAHV